jgi:hypothetical protein
VKDAQKQGKIGNTGILSVSYDYAIERFLWDLGEYGFGNLVNPDHIIANRMESRDMLVRGLTLEIYEEKGRYLEQEFFNGFGFKDWNTYYVGDTDDDEPIADMIPKGHFITSRYATDDFKQKMARGYKAREAGDLPLILRE